MLQFQNFMKKSLRGLNAGREGGGIATTYSHCRKPEVVIVDYV